MHFTHFQSNQNNRRNQHNHHHSRQQKPIEMEPTAFTNLNATGVAILICLIACGVTKTNAVPTDSRYDGVSPSAAAAASYVYPSRPLLLHWHHLARREAPAPAATEEEVGLPPLPAASLVQDESAASGSGQKDNTAEDQPKGLCLLDGVLVAEASAVCEKQIGCRAIQKTGHCCPDYKCDCEKDGKTYSNGDKLVDPDTPCTVCYCQGGEILCSSVTCFHRDDCSPKYIPGRCCPEYDNCPVLSAQTNKTVNANQSQAPPKPDMPPSSALITIKEITKPIEIRITDDNKAIPIHQMLKPSTTTTTTTTTTVSPTTSSTTSATSSSTTSTTTTTPAPPSTTTATLNEASSTPLKLATSTPVKVGSSSSADANHESSSSSKATATHHHTVGTSSVGGLNSSGNLKLSASVAYPSTSLPPSLTDGIDGDRTLTTLLEGAGSVAEREVGSDPSKVNKREYMLTTEDGGSFDGDDYAIEPEAVFSVAESESGVQSGELAEEPETAGSDNIYHIIMTTGGPKGSNPNTEGYVAIKGVSTEGFNSDLNNGVHEAHTTRIQSTTEGLYSSSERAVDPSTESPLSSTTTAAPDAMSSTTESHHMDEEEGVMEPNPAYPSLPEDDFSLRFPLTDNDDVGEPDLKDEPRTLGGSSPVFDAMKSTKQLDDPNNEGSGSGAGMIMDPMTVSTTETPSTSESPLPMALPDKIPLMYSAEDLSEETKISNSTELHVEKMDNLENDTGSGLDSLEVAVDESLAGLYGSGSGDFMPSSTSSAPTRKEREPTTPRPTRRPLDLDIDELGSAWSEDGNSSALLEDPKLDVESLKVDENKDEGGVVKTDAKGAKDSVLSIKASNPAEDKTFEEIVPKQI